MGAIENETPYMIAMDSIEGKRVCETGKESGKGQKRGHTQSSDWVSNKKKEKKGGRNQ